MKKAILILISMALTFPVTAAPMYTTDYVKGIVDGTYYTTLLQIAKTMTLTGVPEKDAVGEAVKCAGRKANVVEFVVKNLGLSITNELTMSIAISETMYMRCEKRLKESA